MQTPGPLELICVYELLGDRSSARVREGRFGFLAISGGWAQQMATSIISLQLCLQSRTTRAASSTPKPQQWQPLLLPSQSLAKAKKSSRCSLLLPMPPPPQPVPEKVRSRFSLGHASRWCGGLGHPLATPSRSKNDGGIITFHETLTELRRHREPSSEGQKLRSGTLPGRGFGVDRRHHHHQRFSINHPCFPHP